MALSIPLTFPVNVGLANIVVLLSLITFPSPTIVFSIPLTVPVNVGLASGAFKAILVVTVAA